MRKIGRGDGRSAENMTMPMHEEPLVGATYENPEGRTFKVTAFDEDEGTLQVMYEDDSTETIDLDAWYDMDLEMIDDGEEDDEDEDLDVEEADDEVDLDDEDDDDLDEDEQ
jgi:ribonuclease E